MIRQLITLFGSAAGNHIIDGQGKFNSPVDQKRIVEKDEKIQFIVARSDETEIGNDITITETDIFNANQN